jgi:hypothetical protein
MPIVDSFFFIFTRMEFKGMQLMRSTAAMIWFLQEHPANDQGKFCKFGIQEKQLLTDCDYTH